MELGSEIHTAAALTPAKNLGTATTASKFLNRHFLYADVSGTFA
jgi:hypothetical protein